MVLSRLAHFFAVVQGQLSLPLTLTLPSFTCWPYGDRSFHWSQQNC